MLFRDLLFLLRHAGEMAYYLVPGMLLGFGLAVYPHREALCRGTGLPRRWRGAVRVLPEAAMKAGWLLMAATLLLCQAGGQLPAQVLAGCCFLLDMAAVGAVVGHLSRARCPAEAELIERR